MVANDFKVKNDVSMQFQSALQDPSRIVLSNDRSFS